jgi:hypothetical protein
MMKLISIVFCLFLFSCGGDGSNHPPNPSPIPEPTPHELDYIMCNEYCADIINGVCLGTHGFCFTCAGISYGNAYDADISVCISPEPPEPENCCPKGANMLICKNYLTESPYLTVQCNEKGYWYLSVKDANSNWKVPLWIKLPLPDLSCCPIEKTGLLPEQCTAMKPCYAYYAQPTDWVLFSKMEGWYIGNIRTYESYKVIN